MLLSALAAASTFVVLAADFRAAAIKVDITPSEPQWLMGYAARKSTGVHDRIFHRIAILDDGTTQFYLISSDLCVFSPTVYDHFTRDLQQRTGINPLHVWWTTTHTHSAPELGPPGVYDILLKGRSDHEWSREYLAFVRDRLFEGIQKAKSQLAPARLGVGTGMSMANINRRARDVDGKISLGLNPEGVVDRQIGLLKIERADGAGPIALIANYAMHGTVRGGRWMQISGDGPGVVADYVEQKNSNAPMLFINSAAGNIAPIYSVYDTPAAGHLRQFNVLLGDRILETARNIATPSTSVQLTASERIFETARKPELGWWRDRERYS
jgi:neutral ceramidase